MATQIRNGYLSPQVWVSKNATKVLEILGKLTPARVEYAENIFGGEKYLGENNEVRRDYSILTMVISEGEGDTRKCVKYNFNPQNFTALQRECEPSVNYHRSYERQFTKMDFRNGNITIRKATIRYEYFMKDRDGKVKKDKNGKEIVSQYPWFIGLSEETGKADQEKRSIIGEKKKVQSYINMTSDDYQCMVDNTCRYIDVYAMAFGPELLRKKFEIMRQRREEYLSGAR